MSVLPPPTCELDQWMLAEVAKRRRSGESISTLLVGTGADEQALRVAASGARVLLLSDHDPGHVNIVQRPLASFADTAVEYPLQPFDIILCQRMLSSLRYAEARAMVRRLLGRLRIGGKLFVSCYGIHSDLGEHYADGEKLVGERFAEIAPDLAGRHGISGPLCLYSERNLFMLLMECGAAVIKTSSSALGHVRGVAARI
ncbi:MAG TPA: hypothetical protein PLE72_00580 [Azospira sp.]|nr:hypothetical protein [Azospira sp.]